MKAVAQYRRPMILALAVGAGAAMAATLPEAIKKLSGSSEDSARSVMAQNGYLLRGEKSSWGRELTYWWSDKARQCVQLMSLAGRIMTVDAKGESDRRGSVGSGGNVGIIDPALLVGMPRAAVDTRLSNAGLKLISSDTRLDTNITYVWWYDGRRCLAGNIANERYEMLEAKPLNQCAK